MVKVPIKVTMRKSDGGTVGQEQVGVYSHFKLNLERCPCSEGWGNYDYHYSVPPRFLFLLYHDF